MMNTNRSKADTETAEMASGDISPCDFGNARTNKADSADLDTKRDRQDRSLVKNLPPGPQKPANRRS